MSKTIEEIKDEVAREFLHPYRTWLENSRFSNDDNISVLEDSEAIDEVAKRYAQSQTQELQEQNAELVSMLESIMSMSEEQGREGCTWGDTDMSSIDVCFGENTMLRHIKSKIHQLLTKYNHLNKKP